MSSVYNWVLRGGYRLLVVWRPDTGASFATGVVRPVAFAHERERRTVSTGARQTVGVTRSVAPELAGWAEVETLRAWEAAGVEVRAVLVALGRGKHYQWEEAVPVDLDPFDGLFGSLTGDRLHLFSAAYDARVFDSPSLLAPLSFAEDGDWTFDADGATVEETWGTDEGDAEATLGAAADETVALYADRVIPAPGLGLHFAARFTTVPAFAGAVAVEMFAQPLSFAEVGDPYGTPNDFDEVAEPVIAAGVVGVSLTLPAGAYAVRVGVRLIAGDDPLAVSFAAPALLTREPAGAPVGTSAQFGLVVVETAGARYLIVSDPSSADPAPSAAGPERHAVTVPDAAVASLGADGDPATLYTDS